MLTKIGLDLGYANITLSDAASGIYREPSVALVDNDSRKISAVGNAALMCDNKGGASGMLVRPFKNGLLFDKAITAGIIDNAVRTAASTDSVRCVFGVPSDILPKQERELADMLLKSGVNECLFVNRAMAALVGAGYSPRISALVVDIGAGSTEIMLLHNGDILYQKRAAIGGEDFDKAVKQYIADQGDVNVSLSVAKAIKERLGSVWPGRADEAIDIEGTLALTGNKVKMTISTEDIVGVFEKPLRELITVISDGVQKIPAELVRDIFANGIILTGGGSEMYGLDIMVGKVLDISVTTPENPLNCVAKGLSRINNIVSIDVRANGKNITEDLAELYDRKRS